MRIGIHSASCKMKTITRLTLTLGDSDDAVVQATGVPLAESGGAGKIILLAPAAEKDATLSKRIA